MSGKLILWVLFNLPFDEYVTAFIDGINKKRSHDYFCSSPLASNELVKMLWGGAGGGAQGKGGGGDLQWRNKRWQRRRCRRVMNTAERVYPVVVD